MDDIQKMAGENWLSQDRDMEGYGGGLHSGVDGEQIKKQKKKIEMSSLSDSNAYFISDNIGFSFLSSKQAMIIINDEIITWIVYS